MIKIKPLTKNKIKEAIKIIEIAFGKKEARAAKSWLFLDKKLNSTVLHSSKRFLAFDKSKVVGICGIYSWKQHPKDICWLGWYAVLPEYRNKKIGSKLLKHTLDYAKKKGYRIFCIETTSHKNQSEARDLYKRFGFKKVGQIPGFWEDYDILFLSKKLK